MKTGPNSGGSWRDELCSKGVASETLTKLEHFLELLARFGGVLDLTGPGAAKWAGALLMDSVAVAEVLPPGAHLLDVGSGNGFPALPLVIMRPDITAVLLEPRERRWAFLREVVRELGVRARVERGRIEEHRAGPYEAMTVRALAPSVWSRSVETVVVPGGVIAWWAAEHTSRLPEIAGAERMLTLPLPGGRIEVWRRCFT